MTLAPTEAPTACSDDSTRRRSGKACDTFLPGPGEAGRRRALNYCQMSSARRRDWGGEARDTCRSTCSLCHLATSAPTQAPAAAEEDEDEAAPAMTPLTP